ncbi:MAG: hypothetical protein M3N41_11645 [Acidobacteriota bacterium]|nr:hypothetical protein [Acidobacteriota bacterium]
MNRIVLDKIEQFEKAERLLRRAMPESQQRLNERIELLESFRTGGAGVSSRCVDPSPVLPAATPHPHDEGREQLKKVLAKSSLKSFLIDYPGLGRTSVTDYKAGRIERRVSPEKCAEIKAAALATAAKLGL